MSKVINIVFKLMNEIKSNVNRSSVKDAHDYLHRSDLTSGNIGYQGRRLYKQFLGYLIIHGNRDKINKNHPMNIGDLPQDTVDILTYAHSYISEINRLCLSPLQEIFPAAFEVINPYWNIEGGMGYANPIDISSEFVDELVAEFKKGKGLGIIQNRINLAPQIKDIKEQDIASAVYSMIERIDGFDLKNCPPDFSEMAFKLNNRDGQSAVGAIIFSLIDIYSSMQIIDQLIYQAFVYEKFICLDEDNIYGVSFSSSNAISNVIEVTTGELIHIPGEVIVINPPFDTAPSNKFYQISRLSMHFSQDFGNETIVGARSIGNSASVYSNIVNYMDLL